MDVRLSELRTPLLFAAVALTLLAAGTALADVLVETDSERLQEIVALLEEDVDGRVDRLATYADAERVPVLVSDGGHAERLRDGADLRGRLHEVLEALDAEDAELLQVTSALEGDEGRVTLRVRSDGEVSDLELTLRREGQTFLLTGARRLG
jgi:hypothetical protein